MKLMTTPTRNCRSGRGYRLAFCAPARRLQCGSFLQLSKSYSYSAARLTSLNFECNTTLRSLRALMGRSRNILSKCVSLALFSFIVPLHVGLLAHCCPLYAHSQIAPEHMILRLTNSTLLCGKHTEVTAGISDCSAYQQMQRMFSLCPLQAKANERALPLHRTKRFIENFCSNRRLNGSTDHLKKISCQLLSTAYLKSVNNVNCRIQTVCLFI